MEVCGA